MKQIITVAICITILFFSTTFLKASVQENLEQPQLKHNIVISYEGEDKNIPLDGELLIIRKSLEDTIIVGRATPNDAINFLEENGHG